MTPELWQTVKEVLHGALELPPADRSAYLEQACGGDAGLRAEVESLLQSYGEAGEFIDSPALGTPLAIDESAEAAVGTVVGAYRVTGIIGEGGMGTVYRAVRADDEFRTEVAIKVLRRGMEMQHVVERFRNERQILAGLNHPYIAKLFDGGTTADGRPYFVMELIVGKPLDEYCDEHRLSTPERLRLFQKICSAVLYAHQNLIVHRDLKPSNILVTGEGAPKLLDFGIAKILGPEAAAELPTMTIMRMMTPEYASPEQIRGDPITTATDVYSLGVVLYEILTGHRPYRLRTRQPHELAHAICELDPEKPSNIIDAVVEVTVCGKKITLTPEWVSGARDGRPEKLRRRLQGDLDNIVLMAMKKDPQRRYASAGHLAADLERHLTGKPVNARQDTLAYRAGKFFQRHKAPVVIAALGILALIGGTVATAWEAHVARIERARAERRFNDVRRVANSFLFEIHDAIRDLPGSTPARELIVRRGLEFLDGLARESKNNLSLQRELAAGYERVGDVQGQSRQASLGDTKGAMASYRKALAMRESLAAADPNDLTARRELVPNYGKLSDLFWSTGDLKSAMEFSRRGLTISESLASAPTATKLDRQRLATNYLDYGYKQAIVEGDLAGGLENCRKSLRMFEELTAADPNRLLRRIQALGCDRVAEILEANPKTLPEALAMRHTGLTLKKELLAADPVNTDLRRLVAYSGLEIGGLRAKLGDSAAALQEIQAAMATLEALATADPKNVQYQQDKGLGHLDVATVMLQMGDWRGATAEFQRALDALEHLTPAGPPNMQARFQIADARLGLGKAYSALASDQAQPPARRAQLWAQAETWYKQSLPDLVALRDAGNLLPQNAPKVVEASHGVARCEAELKMLGR